MTHLKLSISKCFTIAIINIAILGAAAAQSTTPTTETSINSSAKFNSEASCIRHYIYKGRTYPVDSSRKMDGEGLRVVLRKNPDSEEILNSYQHHLRTSKIPAYFGTAGLLSLIIGPIYASTLDESPLGKRDTRYISLLGGAGILFGSYFWGIWNINKNEKRLVGAVDGYNQAIDRSEQIQVNFTPTPSGDGGQIKTIVPFQF